MKFIVDAQLPPALARCLVRLGHESEHVLNVGLLGADDRSIQQYATAHNIVVITKDEDFAANLLWQKNNPAVVWLRVGNCSNQALLNWFLPILPKILLRLQEGEKLVEVV
jgi:predicted nuclease of predicted toxin-antitoxin system